ncbi:MAG: alpha/beta hydrolase [Verrucomicrobiae bacterium]|nr:alpha/beta hydrolase [Verrucomicrobiae bacterium]
MEFNEDIELTAPHGVVTGLAEYGDPNGMPVFFFHGWPSSRRQGRILHEPARARGLRIIAMDRPGIGKSTFVPDRQLLDWPPLLAQLAEAMEIEKFAVLGVSGGGPYVLASAFALPHRLTAAGIICGAPPLAEFADLGDLHPGYRLMRLMRRYAAWSMPPFLPFARLISRLAFDHPLVRGLKMTVPKLDRLALDDRLAFEAVALSFQDASSNGMRPLIVDGDIYFSAWGFDLAEIQVPVRIWHGERDRNIPVRMVREVAQRIPRAVAKWYPDDGHYSLPILRRGEILDELVADAASRS